MATQNGAVRIGAACAVLLWSACGAGAEEVVRARYSMGTLLRVTLTGGPRAALDAAADRVFDEVDRWDRLLSTYKPDSEVSRINSAAPERVRVSADTAAALEAALEWARRSEGAFDPSTGPLIRLWGFEGNAPGVPTEEEIEKARGLVRCGQVELSTAPPSVRLPVKGMALNFGGIGKGWALDKALAAVRAEPALQSAVLDFGGQLLFWSRSPRAWPAAVRHPRGGGPETFLTIAEEGSLSTSAASERFFTAPDPKSPGRPARRYGHILDPRTGYPAGMRGSSGADAFVESVTVWARSATEADALSTAIFVMGPEAGAAFAEREGAAAYILHRNSRDGLASKATRAWENKFSKEKHDDGRRP